MNAKGLLKMADFLENVVPDDNFDLLHIINKKGGYDHESEVVEELEKFAVDHEYFCGATACVIGWMPAVFPELIEWNEHGEIVFKNQSTTPRYSFSTAEKFFGINPIQAYYLFVPYPPNYMTKQDVIARIREFVKNNGEIPNQEEV